MRRRYRDLLSGNARNQTDQQFHQRLTELRALSEVIVDMFLDRAADPQPEAPVTSEDVIEIDDQAETLAGALGISLAEARRLAHVNYDFHSKESN